jgi:hypothetical protein
MIIERDKKNLELQNEVFGKINDIFNSIDPVSTSNNTVDNNVKFVDIESAAKELLALGIKG